MAILATETSEGSGLMSCRRKDDDNMSTSAKSMTIRIEDAIPSEVPRSVSQNAQPTRPVEPSATASYKAKSSVAYELSKLPLKASRRLKISVAGAGISALSFAHAVEVGQLENVDLKILEKNAGLGGTWFENRYPGCACDVPSHNYLVSHQAPSVNCDAIFTRIH